MDSSGSWQDSANVSSGIYNGPCFSWKAKNLTRSATVNFPNRAAPTMKTECVTYRLLEWCPSRVPVVGCSIKGDQLNDSIHQLWITHTLPTWRSLLNSHISNVKYDLHNAEAGYCDLLYNLYKLYLLLLSITQSAIKP
jgi:hypothetical protein